MQIAMLLRVGPGERHCELDFAGIEPFNRDAEGGHHLLPVEAGCDALAKHRISWFKRGHVGIFLWWQLGYRRWRGSHPEQARGKEAALVVVEDDVGILVDAAAAEQLRELVVEQARARDLRGWIVDSV